MAAIAVIEKKRRHLALQYAATIIPIATILSKSCCRQDTWPTFASSNKNNNIMKALIIIASCIALSIILKVADILTSRKTVNSVGARANGRSKGMTRIDINDPEQLSAAIERYKHLAD